MERSIPTAPDGIAGNDEMTDRSVSFEDFFEDEHARLFGALGGDGRIRTSERVSPL
jgi:hypothetical protein